MPARPIHPQFREKGEGGGARGRARRKRPRGHEKALNRNFQPSPHSSRIRPVGVSSGLLHCGLIFTLCAGLQRVRCYPRSCKLRNVPRLFRGGCCSMLTSFPVSPLLSVPARPLVPSALCFAQARMARRPVAVTAVGRDSMMPCEPTAARTVGMGPRGPNTGGRRETNSPQTRQAGSWRGPVAPVRPGVSAIPYGERSWVPMLHRGPPGSPPPSISNIWTLMVGGKGRGLTDLCIIHHHMGPRQVVCVLSVQHMLEEASRPPNHTGEGIDEECRYLTTHSAGGAFLV